MQPPERADSGPAPRVDGGQGGAAQDVPTAVSWRVIGLCALICLLDGYDMAAAAVSAPLVAADWGIAPQAFSVALAASIFGIALGAAFIAPLGDRFGRRPVTIGGFLVVGAASLATCVAADVSQFAVLRLAVGLGLGTSIANAIALAAEYAHLRVRSRVVTVVYSMAAVGGTIGPFMTPPLVARLGWEGIYVVGGVAPLLLAPVLLLGLRESPRFVSQDAATHAGPETGKVRGRSASGNVKMLLSSSHRAATLTIWLMFFLGAFTSYMVASWLPTLMRLSGWPMDVSVRALGAYSLGGVLGGFLLGWLVDRGRTRLSLLLAFGVAALAFAALPMMPPRIPAWITVIMIMGAGSVGCAYVLTSIAALVYPTSIRASGIGVASAIGRLGATVAPLAGGWLLANDFSPHAILASLAAPMAAAWLIALRFSGRFRRPSES